MKKILSLVLVLALVLALAVPAFATTTNSQEITDPSKLANEVTNKVTGTTSVGTLKLTVPTANAVVLNPYGLSLNITAEGKEDATGSATTTQVISPAQDIKNESTSGIKVSATVTGTANGNVKFSPDSLSDDTTTKTNSVHMKLVAAAPSTTATSAPLTAISEAKSIVVATKTSAKTELGTLPAGDAAAGGPQYMAFQLQGDAVSAPTTPWTTKDTVVVQIAFTFDLVAGSSGGGGGAGPTVTATITEAANKTSIASGETATLTVALDDNTKTISSVAWTSDDTSNTYVSLSGSTNDTETVSWVSASGSVTIQAVVTYDGGATATATFALGTT